MVKKKVYQIESDLPKISAPAMRALASVGIKKLSDFTKFTESEIMNLHGMGPNAMSKIRLELKGKNFWFSHT